MNVLQNLQMFFAGYNTPGATTLENYDDVRGTSVEVDAVDWPIRICRTDTFHTVGVNAPGMVLYVPYRIQLWKITMLYEVRVLRWMPLIGPFEFVVRIPSKVATD